MYYFYSPQMFAPYHWGLERDVSYAYMPYDSFYYGDYISSLPYVYTPQNYEVQMKADDRCIVDTIFMGRKICVRIFAPYNKAEVALTFDDTRFRIYAKNFR